MIELRTEPVTDAVRAEVAAAFDARLLAKVDTSAGMVQATDTLASGQFFRAYVDGVPVLFYVLEARQERGGLVAEVTLAHGRAGVDLVRAVLPRIEAQARAAGCRCMRIETRRAGLVRKLEGAGYDRASVILTKELT